MNHEPAAIKAARLARGWSQRELAARAGVSTTTVHKAETGALVYASKLRAITDTVGLTRSDDGPEVPQTVTDRARTVSDYPPSWIVLDLPEDVLAGLTAAERDEVQTEARRAALQAARERRTR